MHNDFYRALEDVFRGENSLIKKRLEVYIPFILPLHARYPEAHVVDVGCGRGEWLDLLRDNGVESVGVDLDESMLEASRKLGLNVHCGDALDFLKQLPSGSVSAITGFHIVEHLEFQTLQELFQEALRVLKPFGLVIFETPNAENLHVGACGFYLDPTHRRPLPINLLGFLPSYYGYDRVKVLRLQEDEVVNQESKSLTNVLMGVSPDYAIVAQKGGVGIPPDISLAFEREYGVSLQDLSSRYDRQTRESFSQLEKSLDLLSLNIGDLRDISKINDRKIGELTDLYAESEVRFYNLNLIVKNLKRTFVAFAVVALIAFIFVIAFVFVNL